MTGTSGHPRPADPAAVVEILSRALLYEERRRGCEADHTMGRMTAEVLLAHLVGAGFVIMRRENGPAPEPLECFGTTASA